MTSDHHSDPHQTSASSHMQISLSKPSLSLNTLSLLLNKAAQILQTVDSHLQRLSCTYASPYIPEISPLPHSHKPYPKYIPTVSLSHVSTLDHDDACDESVSPSPHHYHFRQRSYFLNIPSPPIPSFIQCRAPFPASLNMSSSVASSHAPSYRLAVSSIPTSIVYSPESIYIVCQLRRSDANSQVVANAISDMHQTGSALTLIRALVDHVLKSNPKPPSLQHAIDLRDVVFTTLKGSSPTYAIHFSAMLPNNGSQGSSKPSYARRGTDLYNSLEQLLLSFVFDKWHEKVHDLAETLSVSKELLQAIHFLIPPLNYPMYRPVAFLSGFSPSSFGRRFIHLDFLIKNIHVAIKPHLDPTSLLHNPVNFRQAFGIEARTSYVQCKYFLF